jgi:hypothetical protein
VPALGGSRVPTTLARGGRPIALGVGHTSTIASLTWCRRVTSKGGA